MNIHVPKKKVFGLTIAGALLIAGGIVSASSHREAPMISQDPAVDATDLYAFVSPDRPDTVTLLANYIPFEEPAGGPNFNNFDESALYKINVDNNGDAKEDISYQFQFKRTVLNNKTFLNHLGPISSLNDPNFNVRVTYTLTKIEGGASTILGTDLPVPPDNIGPKAVPNYAALSNSAIKDVGTGIKVFAGQVDDPFFVELGGLFDLLTIRKLPGNAGGGTDGLNGYSTHTLALQIPIDQLTKTKTRITNASDPNAIIGVWTTSYRQAMRVLSPGVAVNSGEWVQVSRLGAPLVNEVVIPLEKKDVFNASQPKDDTQFANLVTDPELAKLLNALYGIKVPPQGAFGSSTARNDLVTVFLTGVPGLNQPANVVPSEELRLNTAIAPSANPNNMGVIGGDTQGYPNGRRLADDITDISIRVVAGAVYPLLVDKNFVPDPTGLMLGDGVDANDKTFRTTFPYVALPTSGFDSLGHGGRYLAILLEILKYPLEKLMQLLPTKIY